VIGMEACGGAHHWARAFQAHGIAVKLIAPQFVKPYVKSNKNDANDAEAICEAMSRPNMRFVAVKTIEQQDIQAVHRVRFELSNQRKAKGNQIRGLVAEYGLVAPKELWHLRAAIPVWLEDAENGLSARFRRLLNGLWQDLLALDQRMTSAVRGSDGFRVMHSAHAGSGEQTSQSGEYPAGGGRIADGLSRPFGQDPPAFCSKNAVECFAEGGHGDNLIAVRHRMRRHQLLGSAHRFELSGLPDLSGEGLDLSRDRIPCLQEAYVVRGHDVATADQERGPATTGLRRRWHCAIGPRAVTLDNMHRICIMNKWRSNSIHRRRSRTSPNTELASRTPNRRCAIHRRSRLRTRTPKVSAGL